MKYSRVSINCTECGREVFIKKYLLNKPTKSGRFCSLNCKSKYFARENPACQPRRTPVNCFQCGKEMQLEQYRILERNFCSNSCRAKYGLTLRWPNGPEMTITSCEFCRKTLNIQTQEFRSKQKRKQNKFFCDRKCFGGWKAANWIGEKNPSWKGGWTPHGTGWRAACEIVRHEQDYACADCHVTEKELGKHLDVHHKIPARLFENKRAASKRENLIGLCHPCHMVAEYSN